MPAECGNTAATRALALDPERVSLKRAAWAFGCAKTGSEEERALRELLRLVMQREEAR